MITLGLLLLFAGLVLAFEAGRSHGAEAALWRGQLVDQLEAATTPSRLRHPSSLGVDPRTVVDDEISSVLAAAPSGGALSIDQAAAYSSIGRSKLYDLIRSGEIQVVKVGSRTIVPRSELDSFIARRA